MGNHFIPTRCLVFCLLQNGRQGIGFAGPPVRSGGRPILPVIDAPRMLRLASLSVMPTGQDINSCGDISRFMIETHGFVKQVRGLDNQQAWAAQINILEEL